MTKVERVSSGIKGLDALINGGFVQGSATLISGGAGTGKTIFCLQYVWDGLQKGENCMYITLEEKPEDIIGDAVGFGWDLKKYVDNGQLKIEYKDPFKVTDLTTPLINELKETGVQRVVVDSTSTMGLYFKDNFEVRKQLFKLLNAIKGNGMTAVVTAEIVDHGTKISRFGVEEFATDAVIVLRSILLGTESSRTLEVRKMRRTKVMGGTHTFDFKKNGIEVTD